MAECPDTLMLHGDRVPCRTIEEQMLNGSRTHDGWPHGNRSREVIWDDKTVVVRGEVVPRG